MPTLSSVTLGSTVKIPLKGVTDTIDGIMVAYNNFSRSEATLVISPNGVWGLTPVFAAAYADNTGYDYRYSGADQFCQFILDQLSPPIKAGSILVPVITKHFSGMVGSGTPTWSSTSKTMYRSAFLPSISQVADGNVYYNSYSFTKPSTGSLISRLSTYLKTNDWHITVRDITESGLYMTGNWGSNGLYFTPSDSGSTGQSTSGVSWIYPVILLTLDGRMEVSSTSGGNITNAMAVESYRKINGVWYRTT